MRVGQSVAFKKGIPTQVPPGMHEEVMERGILPLNDDGSSVDPVEHEAVTDKPKLLLAPDDGDERAKLIKQVFKAMVSRNNSSDFTASGTPNAAAVTSALGWKIDQKEVRTVWEKSREELIGAKSQLAA
jgi:hypothetical protein